MASIRATAKLLGCSEGTLRGLIRRGVLTTLPGGGLDPERARAEYARRRPKVDGGGVAGLDGYRAARTRRERAAAELAELELALRRRELRPVGEMESVIFEVARRVGEKLGMIPARLTPVVVGLGGRHDDVYAAIEAEVNQVRDELANMTLSADKAEAGP